MSPATPAGPALLERRLLVVTGKGGVGKTTTAAALGLAAARSGRRTIVVEVGEQHRLPRLFGLPDPEPGSEVQLEERLWSTSLDPYRALVEWMGTQVGGRVPARLLGNSSTFQYFVAAAPGAREVVSMVKVWELVQPERWRGRGEGYDLAIMDAPATGHALAMLRSPRTIASLARVGPVAGQAVRVRELLDDPGLSGYVAVAQPTEMAVTETLELEEKLRAGLGRSLGAVVMNAMLPRRFSPEELAALDAAAAHDGALGSRAAHAAHSLHDRGRAQQTHLARLRRAGLDVHTVPFMFVPDLGPGEIERISARLDTPPFALAAG